MGDLKYNLKEYKLKDQLKIQNTSLKDFNNMMYGLIFLIFLTILLSFLNTYYDFRSHICKHSNVKKCLAADKICSHTGQVNSSSISNSEFISNQNFIINLNLGSVVNQQLKIQYPNPTNSDPGPCIFYMDFNFTDSVPTGPSGVSNVLNLGASAGYFTNTHGVSIYLYPFTSDGITGTSVSQIEYIISQGMLNSSKVGYLDEAFEYPKNDSSENTGVIYLKGDNNSFQLGGFIKNNSGSYSSNNYEIVSDISGKTSLFNNYSKTTTVPMEKIYSADDNINISEIIKTNNYISSQHCNENTTEGCVCSDPVLLTLPDCNNYYYDSQDKIYKLKTSSKGSQKDLPGSVRFCSYFPTTDSSSKNSIQLNEPPTYDSTLEGAVLTNGYYYNGYRPGEGEGGTNSSERYQLPSIFCSDTNNLNSYKPKNNKLYKTGTDTVDLTTAYGSCQPNAILSSNGVVNLGHPN